MTVWMYSKFISNFPISMTTDVTVTAQIQLTQTTVPLGSIKRRHSAFPQFFALLLYST